MTESTISPGLDYASRGAVHVAPDPMIPPEHDRRSIWRWFAGMMGLVTLAYLLLQNLYWVPGGDSDFYLTVARNLARGEGFTYNGAPVAISPPGWPWAMGMVMKLAPYFAALKLVAMTCMLGSLAISYFIALRFLPPRFAAIAIGLTALLFPLYSLTYFLHSEGLYCLLSALALLLAFRVREEPSRKREAVALVLLCIAIPFVRWAGILQMLPIVGVLLSGPWRRDGRRRWVLAILCCISIITIWYGTRVVLEKRFHAFVTSADTQTLTEIDTGVETSEGATVAIITTGGGAERGVVRVYLDRLIESGRWFSWLLWYPGRFVSVSKALSPLVLVTGWVVIALLAYLTIVRARRGDLLWLALAMYCGALCMNWPNPNARYLVPVAPLILVGSLMALRTLGMQFPSKTFDLWKWMRRALVYSILLVNFAMYSVDFIVMRSSNFYADFEAGQHKDLVDIAAYLNALSDRSEPATTQEAIEQAQQQFRPRDGEVVVNERYENVGKVRMSKASTRAMTLLTDRIIKPLDPKKSKAVLPLDPQPDGTLAFPGSVRKEIRRVGGRWMLAQTPVVPWRVWHFRLPRNVYERLSEVPVRTDSGGWTLYSFDRHQTKLTPQPVPPSGDWPVRVPGM